jgi:predicted RNA-binding Zn-ribbon protein involved in translation (DUF1610 family)
MKSFARRIERLTIHFGSGQSCPTCGKPLDDALLWQQGLMLKVVVADESAPPQCPRCGKPRIIRFTFTSDEIRRPAHGPRIDDDPI